MMMFRPGVPQKIQPWIHLLFAICFQFTGGVYLSQLSQMMGSRSWLREDVMMCAYCGFVGLIMPFPVLFRLKFRFTNRQMLLTASLTIALCNLLALHVTSLPVLCALCYLAGFMKLWGTFECFSNIQLWMTPSRDFAVFFPILYMIVIGDIQFSGFITTHIAYVADWQAVHYFVSGVLLVLALTVWLLTHDFRFMKPLPLYGMDWLGMALWSAALMETLFVFNYGEYYNWLDGPPIRAATLLATVTFLMAVNRMIHIRHPFIEAATWRYDNVVPVLLLFLASDILLSPGQVLRGAISGQLGYDVLTRISFNVWTLLGIAGGCVFSHLWMCVARSSYMRLLVWSFAPLVLSSVWMYFFTAPGMNSELLRLPCVCEGFGQAVLFVALTIYLEEKMELMHFFQGLCVIGMVRTGLASAIGSSIYAYGLRHLHLDNLCRLSAHFDAAGVSLSGLSVEALAAEVNRQAVWMSIRQLYGWTALAGVALVLVLALFDTPVRSTLKRMPDFVKVGRRMSRRILASRHARQQLAQGRE